MRAQRAHSESADLEFVPWATSYIGMCRIRPGPGRRDVHVRTCECVGLRNGVLHCARRGKVHGRHCKNARRMCKKEIEPGPSQMCIPFPGILRFLMCAWARPHMPGCQHLGACALAHLGTWKRAGARGQFMHTRTCARQHMRTYLEVKLVRGLGVSKP